MQSGEFKNLVWDVLESTDDVDAAGNHKRRTTYKKDHIKGVLAIKKAIRDQITMELEVKDGKDEEGKDKVKTITVSAAEYEENYRTKGKILRQLHGEKDIEFNEKMKAALKFYYEDRDELPFFADEESINQLEKIIEEVK